MNQEIELQELKTLINKGNYILCFNNKQDVTYPFGSYLVEILERIGNRVIAKSNNEQLMILPNNELFYSKPKFEDILFFMLSKLKNVS